MAVITNGVTNLGQINVAGDTEALFLKVASGMVLLTFDDTNVTLPRIFTRQMPRGSKSLQFPGVGRAKTKRHEVGANILTDNADADNDTPSDTGGASPFLSNINLGEREVFIDDPLKSTAWVDEWEQFKSSFDAVPPIAEELGRILAIDNDKYVFRLIARGARAVANGGIDWSSSSIPLEHQPDSDGAHDYIDANAGTDASVLLDQIRLVSEGWDDAATGVATVNQEVPQMDRFMALKPQHYNLLVQNQDLLNRDFGGANGIFSDGTVFKAWGITLLKSIHIPTTDSSSDGTTGIRGTNYNVDATGTIGLGWQRMGVGAVRAGSVSMRRQNLLHYGGDLLVAMLGTGYEILRPLHVARIGTS